MGYEYMEVNSLAQANAYSKLGWKIVAAYFKPNDRFMSGETWYVLEFAKRGK